METASHNPSGVSVLLSFSWGGIIGHGKLPSCQEQGTSKEGLNWGFKLALQSSQLLAAQ